MAKEAYVYGKRDLFIWQKRPIHMAKETYSYGKRGLRIWKKIVESTNGNVAGLGNISCVKLLVGVNKTPIPFPNSLPENSANLACAE